MKALFVLLAASAAGAALADDASLLRCRAITDTWARVACYDAIPVTAAGAGISHGAPVAAMAAAPSADGKRAAVPAAPTPTPAATPEQNFGLSAAKIQKAEGQPNFIQSTIVGKLDGWGPGSTFHFANGQVWRVIDGSEATLPEVQNAKVKVTRNFVGTMFLEVEGTNQSPRVRRVE